MPFADLTSHRRLFNFAWPFLSALLLMLLLGALSQQLLSAVRAYVGGESQWSKGQKDAVYYLALYAASGDDDAYRRYQGAMLVPLGDHVARLAMDAPRPDLQAAQQGLLQGGIHPADLSGVIWLYRDFRWVGYVERAVQYWQQGDSWLQQLDALAAQLRARREAGPLRGAEILAFQQQIQAINLQMTQFENAFSNTLAEGARATQRLLLVGNLSIATVLALLALLRTRTLTRQNQRYENALRQSEERLELAISGGDYGIWDWDIIADIVYCSPRVNNMLELGDGAPIDSLNHFAERLHQEDKALALHMLNRHLEGQGPYDIEARLRIGSGAYRWFRAHGQALRDLNGRAYRMSGAVFDIHERKVAELALLAEKEKAQTTLAAIGDAVISVDNVGHVEYLNPVAERMLGFPGRTALGQPVDELFHLLDEAHQDEPLTPLHYLRTVLGEPVVAMASRNVQLLRRDGNSVAVSMVITPLYDHSNGHSGAVLVFHDMTRERQYIASLSWQATHDELTGLANRHEFELRLSQLLEHAAHRNQHHALLYLDLDQFKVVNDTCGHAAGDELLRQVCVLLQQHLREDDTLARLGGDEFGVLLKNCPPDGTLQVAEKLRQTVLDLHFSWGSQPFSVSVSIGVVHISAVPATLKEALQSADVACYLAKEKGRNRVQVYSPGDVELANRHGELEWVRRLHRALDEERFCLYAQRIVALDGRSGPELHFELLLRMQDEHGVLVPPVAYIPAAERYNLMPVIDRWVVKSALAALAASHGRHQRWQCAINLSGTSIGDDGFLAFLREALHDSGIAPQCLCFEITETSAIANLASARRFMRELSALGCRFALDDFGAGMSSFGYLKHLPVDYLKIDGGFVKDMLDDPIDRAMVEMINHIGHVMGKRTIAEFVETAAIQQALALIGVDYAQGYGVAKPQPLNELLQQEFGHGPVPVAAPLSGGS